MSTQQAGSKRKATDQGPRRLLALFTAHEEEQNAEQREAERVAALAAARQPLCEPLTLDDWTVQPFATGEHTIEIEVSQNGGAMRLVKFDTHELSGGSVGMRFDSEYHPIGCSRQNMVERRVRDLKRSTFELIRIKDRILLWAVPTTDRVPADASWRTLFMITE